jgi:DNA mismatch repair protein MutS2
VSDIILLAPARRPGAQRKPDEPSRIAVSYRRPENVNVSLDLHGRRVDEALEMVDKHIDNALAGGLGWVRLIHGQGSGALRRAIHEHLRVNPIVKDCRPGAPNEGAGAVTIVEFR